MTMPTTRKERNIRFLGNNELNVIVSSDETGGNYCVLELITQPRGGANALHTDTWLETFHLIEGEIEWTLERGGELVTWVAKAGETIVVPPGKKHKFVGAGVVPSRVLSVGPPDFESSSARSQRHGRDRTTRRKRRRQSRQYSRSSA